MRSRAMLTSAALAGTLLCVGCSSEDQLKRVEDQVTDLKVEIFKLRTQMEDANKKADEDRTAASTARLQDQRFQADLQETMRQLKDSTRVLNNRLGDMSAQGPPPAQSRRTGKASAPAVPEEPSAAVDEEKAYNMAVLDYNRGNYPLAADGLALFLKTHPQSPRCPDALFYLGLAAYNQKDYQKAQPVFERILKEYSSSAQFLPAKLKRGQCLLKQGLKPAAITAFKEIADSFPGSSEARNAKQELDDLGF